MIEYIEGYGIPIREMISTPSGLVMTVSLIVLYILLAVGLYTMARNREIDHAWFGWIPLLDLYLLGELTGNRMWGLGGSKWILALGPFEMILFAMLLFTIEIFIPLSPDSIFVCVYLFILVYVVYCYSVLYKLYKIYTPKLAAIFTILTILFTSIAPAIIIFWIRNKRAQY